MGATLITAAATLAIVAQDQVPLRASPHDPAPLQAQLAQGDALEVRGQRLGYLQVWDHRRERGGYVLASRVKPVSTEPEAANELLAVMRFLRDTPGSEALGVAYTAAYLRAVPAQALSAEAFDTLGTLAQRLARRASAKQAPSNAVAQLEAVASYGVTLYTVETERGMQLCYDGQAHRQVLAMGGSPEQRANAALGLTRMDCADPQLSATQRQDLNTWRAEVLDQLSLAQMAALPASLKNQVHARRAGVWAAIAYERARQGVATQSAGERALAELATVNKNELADDELADFNDAAMRVGASRWAAAPVPSLEGAARATSLHIDMVKGQPGETCVQLRGGNSAPASAPAKASAAPLAQRCTYGVAWAASAQASADGRTLTLAVQPMPAWTELWVFRRGAEGWTVEVLPPAAGGPELGYVESAGWVAGGTRLLVAREARVDGRYQRAFEVMTLEPLATEKTASTPNLLAAFTRGQDPAWKRATVALR